MADPIIQVDKLSKLYRLGVVGATTFYESFDRFLHRLQGKELSRKMGSGKNCMIDPSDPQAGPYPDSIWALKDISLSVERGEIVGIIGRNGAGKSTLLKILSRITEPTSGRAILRGRVASLLEVGTGFHPELTGRENIYLNGTILGMRKREIDRKFDEIVAFSEVDKFIDTPVKHYSSGMYVRLAFAVAAHLEPEVLLVDEVLAVGDAGFQKKCLGKMNDVAKEGRTILFVSHNMAAVRQLCPQSLLLKDGCLAAQGDTQIVIDKYLSSETTISPNTVIDVRNMTNRSGTGEGRIVKMNFFDNYNRPTTIFGVGKPFRVQLELELPTLHKCSLVVGIEIKHLDGLPIANIRSDSQSIYFNLNEKTPRHLIDIEIPGLPVYPGTYRVEPWFAFKQGSRVDHIHNSFSIVFEAHGVYASELMIQPGRGIILMDCLWNYKPMVENEIQ